jgi:hypothetical protein
LLNDAADNLDECFAFLRSLLNPEENGHAVRDHVRNEAKALLGDCRPLEFEYQGDGEWEASSQLNDEGSRFVWKILVEEEGTFSLKGSDSELFGKYIPPYFQTLSDAKAWAQEKEWEIVASFAATRKLA